MAPAYEEVAKHFEDKSDVVIAHLDSTANEVSDVLISGFPTMLLLLLAMMARL